jgi:MerR family transcriptional regulator, copper efflux regulator
MMMNISNAAKLCGLPAKTIRYYEEIGLVQPMRADNGYRTYSESDVHRLRFVGRARGLGFTVEECRSLLSLYDDDHRASCDVKNMALNKVAEIDRKVEELQSLRDTLATLAEHCHGDERPECPIINDLAGAHPEKMLQS